MEEIRDGLGGVQGHGQKQRLQDEGRGDVHIRAVQAWPERLLRQALGIGRWHPHGANRVPPQRRALAGGNTVSEGTTISSSRTKPRLRPSNK